MGSAAAMDRKKASNVAMRVARVVDIPPLILSWVPRRWRYHGGVGLVERCGGWLINNQYIPNWRTASLKFAKCTGFTT
jgi:hypothetical protein